MSKFFLFLFFYFLSFIQVFAQNTDLTNNLDSNNNGIRDDVDSVIVRLIDQYKLSPPQVSSLAQIALSHQNILNVNPMTRQQVVNLSKRDAAAINCASTRFSAGLLEILYSRLEEATFNTLERQDIYNRYTSLLSEDDNVIPVVVNACEDIFSNNNTSVTNFNLDTNNNSGVNNFMTGIVKDSNIVYPCLVLTRFLEFGSRDEQVLVLQRFLFDTGYMEIYPTGYFGRNTEAAVKLWQYRHGIDIRGYVGPSTRASIASLTCKDKNSIERARLGPALERKTSSSFFKKEQKSQEVNDSNLSVVIIPTTTTNNVSGFDNSNNLSLNRKLSSSFGVFNLSKSPVNPLYFSYKSAGEDVYVCFEKSGFNTCSAIDNFKLLTAQYKPTEYDAIPNGDRWLINLYYSPTNYPNGGKIYFRTINSSPEVYSFSVSEL